MLEPVAKLLNFKDLCRTRKPITLSDIPRKHWILEGAEAKVKEFRRYLSRDPRKRVVERLEQCYKVLILLGLLAN